MRKPTLAGLTAILMFASTLLTAVPAHAWARLDPANTTDATPTLSNITSTYSKPITAERILYLDKNTQQLAYAYQVKIPDSRRLVITHEDDTQRPAPEELGYGHTLTKDGTYTVTTREGETLATFTFTNPNDTPPVLAPAECVIESATATPDWQGYIDTITINTNGECPDEGARWMFEWVEPTGVLATTDNWVLYLTGDYLTHAGGNTYLVNGDLPFEGYTDKTLRDFTRPYADTDILRLFYVPEGTTANTAVTVTVTPNNTPLLAVGVLGLIGAAVLGTIVLIARRRSNTP